MSGRSGRDIPAADRAYALTKELVITGEFPGGHLFSEGDIAQRAGVSRTPVREAFLRLQSEGFLRLIPKRGVIVVPIPPGEAQDVLEAREVVETSAVRRLHRRPELLATALDPVHAALAHQRQVADTGDLAAFAEADEAFHRAIVTAGGNQLLLGFYATLADRQRRMSLHAFGVTPQHVPAVLREHAELLSLIESGDDLAFAQALRAHFDQVHRPH